MHQMVPTHAPKWLLDSAVTSQARIPAHWEQMISAGLPLRSQVSYTPDVPEPYLLVKMSAHDTLFCAHNVVAAGTSKHRFYA